MEAGTVKPVELLPPPRNPDDVANCKYAIDMFNMSCEIQFITHHESFFHQHKRNILRNDFSRDRVEITMMSYMAFTNTPTLCILVTALLLQNVFQTTAFLLPSSTGRCSPSIGRGVTGTRANMEVGKEPRSRRVRFLNKIGFQTLSAEQAEIRKAEKKTKKTVPKNKIDTVPDLNAYFEDKAKRFRDEHGEIDYDLLIKSLRVEGDTQIIGSPDHPDYVHPVVKLVHERKANSSKCIEGPRPDGCRIALVVEGGGMRGCVSAGMVCALDYLGLRESIDVVYGSSAGSIVGAYFVAGQLPWFGPEIYYDKLTTAGRNFIDTRRLLRSLGFGLLDPRLFKDVLTRPNSGKPVLSLPFLVRQCLQESKPLNWEKFAARQHVQPLKVVASGLKREGPVVFDFKGGSFESREELANCMHASCLLPGIAGPVMNYNMNPSKTDGNPKFVARNNLDDKDYEPLGDALIFAPLPYRIAEADGATHVIVLRTRPDGTDVTGGSSFFEKLIFRRFFLRKNKLPNMYQRMTRFLHKKLYAENVIELNEGVKSDRDHRDNSSLHLMAVALPPGSEEVTRLETRRAAIFEGVRRGFARAYDALVEDPRERGRGYVVAREYFPDEILDYDPVDFLQTSQSSFESYLQASGATPKTWDEHTKKTLIAGPR
jgi:predicted acylesterase/phospholipase RssA